MCGVRTLWQEDRVEQRRAPEEVRSGGLNRGVGVCRERILGVEFQGKDQTVHRLWNMKWRVFRKIQSLKQSERRCLDRDVGGESGRREGRCQKELYIERAIWPFSCRYWGNEPQTFCVWWGEGIIPSSLECLFEVKDQGHHGVN